MPQLHVDLQDGFSDDRVVVQVDGREVFRSDRLTTRLMLGLAESFAVDVGEEPVTVRVEVPTRDASVEQDVRAGQTPYVGVSLLQTMLSIHVSRTPFAYL